MSSPRTGQESATLLTLPYEIRLQIYEHLFSFPPRSTLHTIFCQATWVVPALSVCTEMRHAGFSIIFAHNEIHLDIVSYQFASFETVATDSAPTNGVHLPLLALDRRNMTVNPPEYNSEQFYDSTSVLPLPASLLQADLIRNVSITIHLSLYRDSIESVSMKIVFKMLHRLTHKLMPHLRCIRLHIKADVDDDDDDNRKPNSSIGLTSSLLASSADGAECYFKGGQAEARRQRWLESLPSQVAKLPVQAEELQLEDVSDEVFDVIAGCVRVSR